MVILITVAVIAIFIFWAVGAYNRMVKLKEAVFQARLALATHWGQHLDWMQKQLPKLNTEIKEDRNHPLHADETDKQQFIYTWAPAIQIAGHCLVRFRGQLMETDGPQVVSVAVAEMDGFLNDLVQCPQHWLNAPVQDVIVPQWSLSTISRDRLIKEHNSCVMVYSAAIGVRPEAWLAKLVRLPVLNEVRI